MERKIFDFSKKSDPPSAFGSGRGNSFIWKPTKADFVKRPSPVLFVFLGLVLLISQFSLLSQASQAAEVTKTSTGDFDLGINSNVSTSDDEITLSPTSASWYNSLWKYRRKITIDHSKVSEDNVDFPVLIKINATDDPIFSEAQTDGDDILFADSTENTKISHEIEKFDTDAKELWAWVKLPSISSEDDTVLYIYYGNSDCESQQDASNVWTNSYVGVWHLSETSGQHADSTSNNNISTTVSVSAQGTASGRIAGSDDFNGTSDHIQIPSSSSLSLTGNYTISAWAYRDSDSNNWERLIAKTDGSNFDYWMQITNVDKVGGGFINTSSAARSVDTTSGGSTISTGSWSYLSNTLSGTNLSAYLNGSFDRANTSVDGTPRTSTRPLEFGKLQNSYNFNGKIDEVRISSTARSSGWIATEYNNQNEPETFYSVGGQNQYYPVSTSANWYDSDWSHRQKITIDHTKVSADLTDFPVLVSLTESSNSVFANAQTDGDDILFTSSDGTTQLNHEIEEFTPSSAQKDIIAWVKIPSLSSSTDTVFYMYYGNPSSESQQNASGVWGNTLSGVWHLKESSGGAGAIQDSSVNSFDLTDGGSPTFRATGKIGKAISFASASSQSAYKNNYIQQHTDNWTMSAWIKAATLPQSSAIFLYNGNDAGGYGMAVGVNASNSNFGALYGMVAWLNSGSTLSSTESWYHVVMKRSSGTTYFYINGSQTANSSASAPVIPNSYFAIGNQPQKSRYFDGIIDEARVYSEAKSAQWISTEYNNQDSPSSFYTIGDEEDKVYYSSPTSTDVGSGIIDTVWNLGWGSPNGFSANVTIPANTSISFYSRSSSVGGVTDSNWTSWQDLGSATSTGTYSVSIDSMPAGLITGANRYIQLRAVLISDGAYDTGSPALSDYTFYYLSDVSPPVNPSITGASFDGSPIDSGDWSSTSGAINLTFSGATDEESEIVGYYTYFGTSESGDPVNYQEHSGAEGSDQTFTETLDTEGYYYFRVKTKDSAQNSSSAVTLFSLGYDATAPVKPDYITADPAGYAINNSFSFSWPDGSDSDSGIQYYEYKRANDDSWSHTSGTNDKNVADIEAYQEGPNAFYVRSVDYANNPSATYTQVTYYWSGNAPPKPDSLTVIPSSNDQNSFSFRWNKPDVGAGSPIVGYYYSINAPPTISNSTYIASEDAQITVGPDKFATQQGENTVYVVSKNEAGNSSFLAEYYASATFSCLTSAPPAPTSVSIYDSSDKVEPRYILTIQWQAGSGHDSSTFDHYLIERSTDGSNFTELSTVSNSTSFIDDSNLSDELTYYYRLKSVDNAGSYSAASSIVYKQPSGKYTSPPSIIAGPDVEAKATQATITWTTDRASSSFVRYGTDMNNLEESTGQFDSTTNHEVVLMGLSGGSKYYFQVQSVDAERDYTLESAYYTMGSLTTLASPSISNVSVSNITLNSADVSWDTTTVASSKLNMGKTTSYGITIEDISGQSSTKHSTKVTGLEHSQSYHFRITSTDIDGIELTSDDYSFETLPMPKIGSLGAEEIKGKPTQTIKIRWSTNVPTSSIVQYSYAGSTFKEKSKSKLEKEHEIEIESLSDDSLYSIITKGFDQFGNVAISDPISYKTSLDTRQPSISNISVESQTVGLKQKESSQMIISWVTDEPCTSQVLYGEGTEGITTMKSLEDSNLKNNHLVIITGLSSNTIYSFKAVSKDKAGNETSSASQIVVAGEVKKSAITTIIEKLQNIFGWINVS